MITHTEVRAWFRAYLIKTLFVHITGDSGDPKITGLVSHRVLDYTRHHLSFISRHSDVSFPKIMLALSSTLMRHDDVNQFDQHSKASL